MLILMENTKIMRNPPTESMHASTLLPLPDGRVLTAWFGGSREGSDDVGIWMSFRNESGFTSPILIDRTDEPHWNPVLYQCADGRILLFFKVGHWIADWRTMVCESSDGGRTFSPPVELVEGDRSGGRGPVRNKPVRTHTGRILAPASVERGVWRCFIDRSDDDGKTWTKSNMIEVPGLDAYERDLICWMESECHHQHAPKSIPERFAKGRGVIQPTLWEDGKGVHALMRSGEGRIFRSDSLDDGITWRKAYPIDVPNNNSGIDLTRLPDGTMLLVYNPVTENFGARYPLSVAVSKDDGETWHRLLDLETEPGEFSYPAIVSCDNTIHITYTWNRRNIAYRKYKWIDA